jgi:hypothetical protein
MFAYATSKRERYAVRIFQGLVLALCPLVLGCLMLASGCGPSEGETMDQFEQKLDVIARFARTHDAAGQVVITVDGRAEAGAATSFFLDAGMSARAAFLFNAGDEEPTPGAVSLPRGSGG